MDFMIILWFALGFGVGYGVRYFMHKYDKK